MFKTILEQWNAISDIIADTSYATLLDAITQEDLQELVQFLEEFKVASDELEGSSFPTLY
jgi:hypothetical protein